MKPMEGALHLLEESVLFKRRERQRAASYRSGNDVAQEDISCAICSHMDSGFIWANDGEARWSCEQCPA